MIQKLRSLLVKYWDILTYLVFGVLTTVVNYAVYLPVYNFCGISAAVSNMIAWVVAVAFAFLTNKPFVFHSHVTVTATTMPSKQGVPKTENPKHWIFLVLTPL